ncbi:MAG: formylglycine-generating enzyme family protein [Bacteroidota bacterium]
MLRLPETLCLANLEEHMIHIPGGTFMRGGMGLGSNDEPRHEVSLDDFSLCRFPVSQKLWKEVMGGIEPPAWFQHPGRPVERVSWSMVTEAFLPALREKTGNQGYSLPTEAQWEYAARGGPGGGLAGQAHDYYYAGSDRLKEVGWFSENSFEETQASGLKRPNTLGLYDLLGNVLSWCQDRYDPDYYQQLKDEYGDQAAHHPSGPEEGRIRVVRGGSWSNPSEVSGATYRNFNLLPPAVNNLGFRLCRNVSI